jgi:hypothetical protein
VTISLVEERSSRKLGTFEVPRQPAPGDLILVDGQVWRATRRADETLLRSGIPSHVDVFVTPTEPRKPWRFWTTPPTPEQLAVAHKVSAE